MRLRANNVDMLTRSTCLERRDADVGTVSGLLYLKGKERTTVNLSGWNVTLRAVVLRESAGGFFGQLALLNRRGWRILRNGELEYALEMESGGVPDGEATEKDGDNERRLCVFAVGDCDWGEKGP